jgi:hypothetical protein
MIRATGHGAWIEVYVHGTQDADGTVTRRISVHQLHADNPITAAQARQLAHALAAAEAEQMDRYEIGPPDEYDERGEEL